MARKRIAPVVERDVPVGHGCDCADCDGERRGEVHSLYPSRSYCGGCGHGYLFTGGGICTKCGSSEWLEAKPDLPRFDRPRSTRWELTAERTATVMEQLRIVSRAPLSQREAIAVVNGQPPEGVSIAVVASKIRALGAIRLVATAQMEEQA